jgi:acyl transferase domain-containing protein
MVADPGIAVIGIGCRFPGAASPAGFWDLLLAGRTEIRPVPDERVALRAAGGYGGFVDGLDRFDPEFFGISPAEAGAMDPQQRLVLEVAWEALEDAGLVPARLAGSRTGVYIGQSTSDYAVLNGGGPLAELGTYTNPGLSPAVTANRLSYLWDLRGPSLTVDTACSSSLVAVHLAVGALRTGECDLALAGGVNALLSPVPQAGAARLTALSPDGRCRAFDAGANGYVRGEGAGCVVLKRLPDAERDGDPVYAVIAGTAVNQDGRTNGLTAPSGAAQRAVVAEALRAAGLPAGDVDYVEAHGTGTPLGDPIEARALSTALGPRIRPLLVGSVKANIGHLEAAAGIAGLIKVALMLRYATVPPSPLFHRPNPRIDMAGWRLVVPTGVLAWPHTDRPAVAGVSSFGFGGTNAHAVLRGVAPAPPPATGAAGPVLLTLSARSPASLAAAAAAYATAVRSCASWPEVADLAAAAAWERSHFGYRRAVVGADPAELLAGLDAPGGGPPVPRPGRLAFVYAGHGSQWAGMGRDLLDADPEFTAEAERCAAAFAPLLGWSVTAALRGRYRVDLDDVAVAQPLIVTVQLATTAALRARGIVPDAVVGHSVGEVAAAHAAGRLSLVDACRIVHARNVAVAPDEGAGAMAVVDLPASGLGAALGDLVGEVAVAAFNSPRATVLSGPVAAVAAAEIRLRADGRDVRRIRVTYASHCALMTGAAARLRAALDGLADRPARVALYSTVTGGDATDVPLGAGHWAANLNRPVRFAEAVAAMLGDGVTHVVEVGPHPVLVSALGECVEASETPAIAVGTLHRDRPLRHGTLDLVARLYEAGWTPRFPPHRRPRAATALPTYPFDRRPVPTLGFATRVGPGAARPAPGPDLADRLAACLSVVERRAVLSAAMLGLLDEVLPDSGGVADRVAVPFHDLGLDSLMAVELRNRLEKRLRTTLSVALLWRYPTVERLSHALAERSVDSAAGELLRLLDEVDAEVPG